MDFQQCAKFATLVLWPTKEGELLRNPHLQAEIGIVPAGIRGHWPSTGGHHWTNLNKRQI